MASPLIALLLISLLGAVPGVFAQTFQNQRNISMCSWIGVRANVIRDTIYLDGGYLYWQRGRSDDRYDTPVPDYPESDVFTLSLSRPWDKNTNQTALFGKISKTGGTAANNIAPNYKDGVMFANNHEFYVYGGLIRLTDGFEPPAADQVIGYERYQYGTAREVWEPGFRTAKLSRDITRYVTNGAGVSVPSENMGYYFSGVRGKDWGDIRSPSPVANVSADSLITVDLSEMRGEVWDNKTVDKIVPRANAELAWIPVSEKGVLVAIGGVKHPVELYSKGLSEGQKKENNETGPEFMRTVSVYDIASGKWYLQNTTGDIPPMLAQFCSVVASAKDKSSHNVYIYGGYNSTIPTDRPSDDVWVLSIPSFTWVRVYDGNNAHGRRGHKCVRAYPDQMVVVGGRWIDPNTCVDGGIIQVFNLNTLRFQDSYNPEKYEEYKVPDLVTAQIGGNKEGGANKVSPKEWGDDVLNDIFNSKYTKEVETFYPYKLDNSDDSDSTAVPTPIPGGGGGLPKWVAPVLGVVLGLIFITGLAILWLIWRRRRGTRYAPSEAATSDNRRRILGWMYGMSHPTHKTTMTTASTEIGINDKHTSHAGGMSEYGTVRESVASPHPASAIVINDGNAQEAGSSPVHEMQAGSTSFPSELPTEFNVPTITRARSPSNTSSFFSPVSPPVSPEPGAQPDMGLRPTHGRHNSSLSSTGFNASLNDAMANDDITLQRPRYVSGFTEELDDGPSDRDGARK
ncbi:hypothetical protein AJ80_03229 [Polytolypa hystricis UAMH7299]|uniref:Kelch repeat protein n=1 Tax=Polytolypa hystricis (strain UAMH7299) TaxID=1447883 RepID=A0A2B7YKS3_POLH7|nr:hypothetical protein AJ80_03229 [Polytolypa hystricis UAMH7299]